MAVRRGMPLALALLLGACGNETSLVLRLGLRRGDAAPAALVVTVADAHHALKRERLERPLLPGTLLVRLPSLTQTVRLSLVSAPATLPPVGTPVLASPSRAASAAAPSSDPAGQPPGQADGPPVRAGLTLAVRAGLQAEAGAQLSAEVGDVDGDGVVDLVDDCPYRDNQGQDDGDGDGVGDACARALRIDAVTPELAVAGERVVLEGSFGSAPAFAFPGAAAGDAKTEALGGHRFATLVPAAASAGALTVGGGDDAGAHDFARAPYAIGLQQFSPRYEQVEAARAVPALGTPRFGHAGVVSGGWYHVIGGYGAATAGPSAIASVERARVDADGTLLAFADAPAGGLMRPRAFAAAVRVADTLFVLGGAAGDTLDSVEHATIAPDGSLGPFALVDGVRLGTARAGHGALVLGGWLYVVGGFARSGGNTTTLASVERAPLGVDGRLGPFAPVAATLTTARSGAGVLSTGRRLLVIGGFSGAEPPAALQSVEAAPVDGDGNLGAFAASAAALATPRAYASALLVGAAPAQSSGQLYVAGGVDFHSRATASVEGAQLGDDGLPRGFDLLPALHGGNAPVALASARAYASAPLIGGYWYQVGGSADGTAPLATVERAALDASGQLGAFADGPQLPPASLVPAARVAVLGDAAWLLLAVNDPLDHRLVRLGIDAPGALTVGLVANAAFTGDLEAAAVIGSRLYWIGTTLAHADFDPARQTLGDFVLDRVSVPDRNGAASAVVLGTPPRQQLYLVGGGTSIVAVPISDGVIGAFTTTPFTLPVARARPVLLATRSSLYALGGEPATTSGDNVDRAALGSDGLLASSFINSGFTFSARTDFSALVVGSLLYLVGGNKGGAPVATVEVAAIDSDGLVRSFAPLAGLPSPRAQQAGVVLRGSVYQLAGQATSGVAAPGMLVAPRR